MNLDSRDDYPWTDGAGRELYRVLVTLYPSPRRALPIAQRAGVKPWDIEQDQPASSLWTDVLDYCAPRGFLRELAQQAFDDSKHEFLGTLLAGGTPAVSAEPLSDSGIPRFVRSDDIVTEPEALLFNDDLSMSTGRLPRLIGTLQRLVELTPAVAKLTVRAAGAEQYGTAFRVGSDLLLTNWHVVHAKSDGSPASHITAEFGFEDDADGRPMPPTPIDCDSDTVASNESDDWAVVRTLGALDARWPVIELATQAEPRRGDSAFIIQHPMGRRKRVGIVRNRISYVDDVVVQYLTDTEVGSSGSPVLNDDGRLIALHHAGGRPVEALGEPPVRKNEGIRISRILSDLPAGLR